MLFNSIDFLIFFALVTTAYFWLPHRFRWVLLLGSSCVFYMLFIPVYILILFAAILIDFYAAIQIEDSAEPARRRAYLVVSALSVCAILFAFKYFNFFNENAAALARILGWNYPIAALKIALPIGLSFHTFQSLSYVIEVYRGKQKAERHLGRYALFVMYFPQLVAGPIERPQNVLHQFGEEKVFDAARFRDGMSIALWGLFKKVVVADSLALYVDPVYGNAHEHSGRTLLIATYFFAFQIYCDFSGYSDIARGVSKVYGIELMKNFETPYFSTSIGEFWTRWHISLSTWFRDYVYIPLGGNRVPTAKVARNILIVFVLSGFWHGANWTFIVWGALHGSYLIMERLVDRARKPAPQGRSFPSRILRGALTFHLVLLAWVFFRADRVETALGILRRIVTDRGPMFFDPLLAQGVTVLAVFLALEVFNRRTDHFASLDRRPPWQRWTYAMALLFGVVLLGVDRGAQFIYFQF